MKNSPVSLFIIVRTLVITLSLVLTLKTILACPSNIECSNFTDQKKIQDCNYITNHGSLTYNKEQEILCALWVQSYTYEIPQNEPIEPLEINFSSATKELENTRIILAGKIIILILVNYILFSITKSSIVIKWIVGY